MFDRDFRADEGCFGHCFRVPAALKRNTLLTHGLDCDEERPIVFVVREGARESGSTEGSELASALSDVCIPQQRSDGYR
jgi:hypothetical protein